MDKKSEDAPLVVAQTGPLIGQRWPVRSKLVIGRGLMCDIVIADRQVFRQHACLTYTPRGSFAEDMDSKNGTLLNGQTFDEPTLLEDGDLIQIAVVQQFLFLSPMQPLPLDADFQGFEQLPRDCYAWINALGGVDRQSGSVAVLSVSQFSCWKCFTNTRVWWSPCRLDQGNLGRRAGSGRIRAGARRLVRRLRDRLASIGSKPSLYNHDSRARPEADNPPIPED